MFLSGKLVVFSKLIKVDYFPKWFPLIADAAESK